MKRTPFSTTQKLLAVSISMALSNMALAEESKIDDETVEKIQVTGSYIKRSEADAAEPVQVLDHNFIQSTGATTVAELIGKLSISSGAENQADSFTQSATQGTGNINLRGLGLSSTLVLINGRRQTSSGAITDSGSVFVDTSHIPIDAIEQVEILKEGAASTYGSDAIAGVVNFILRKDFQGLEINAGISKTDTGNQTDTDLGLLWGAEFDNTSIVVSAHYTDRTPLSASDKPELIDNAWSGLGNSFLLWGAGSDVTEGPYEGSYSAWENVPDATCGDYELDILLPQANGSRCGFNYGPIYNLVNTETRAQLYTNISHDFDNGNVLSADVSWSSNEVKDNPQSPTYPDLKFPLIAPGQAGNPFGVYAMWLGRPLGASFDPVNAPRENDTIRGSLNLVGTLENGWDFDTALTYSKNTYYQEQSDTLRSRLTAAFNGVGGPNNDELFNLFDKTNVSQSVIDDFTHVTQAEKTTDLLVLDAVISGDLYELPAGTVGFAAGIQVRNESFKVETDEVFEINFDDAGEPLPVDLLFLQGLSNIDESRTSYAVFAESVIPVSDSVEIKAALRYEDLESDSSFDPKIAVRWQISDEFIMRASASTAFREASLSQLYSTAAATKGIRDYDAEGNPASGDSYVGIISRGNEDLMPEQSENYNVGLVYKPTDGLDFSLDYWRVNYTDMIVIESAQGKLIDDPFGDGINRVNGQLSSVEVDFFNSSSVKVEGIDFESVWDISEQFNLTVNASHFLSYDLTTADGTVVDAVGSFNPATFASSLPATKGTMNFNWVGDSQRASVTVSYVSSYDTDVDVIPAGESDTIDAMTTVDAQYSATFGMTEDSDAVLTFGIKNLFDEEPPRAYINTGQLSYDPKQHNPLGRVYYARVKFAF